MELLGGAVTKGVYHSLVNNMRNFALKIKPTVPPIAPFTGKQFPVFLKVNVRVVYNACVCMRARVSVDGRSCVFCDLVLTFHGSACLLVWGLFGLFFPGTKSRS